MTTLGFKECSVSVLRDEFSSRGFSGALLFLTLRILYTCVKHLKEGGAIASPLFIMKLFFTEIYLHALLLLQSLSSQSIAPSPSLSLPSAQVFPLPSEPPVSPASNLLVMLKTGMNSLLHELVAREF